MTNNKTTVINILGWEDGDYFCQSAIKESLLMIPILYFGITVSIAFFEWAAC